MIELSEIKLVPTKEAARLETKITIDGQPPKTLWVETSKDYARFLTYERSDSFVVGMLYWALLHGHDIKFVTPINEHLYYQITRYLIPGLLWGSKQLKNIKLQGPITSTKLECAGYVGTGITCGVDSLYSVSTNETNDFPLHKLTHLTLFNVGSHGEGDHGSQIYKERLKIATQYCAEYNYPLVTVNSNLQDIIQQSHFITATFSAVFAILAMQKMWSIYYLASAGNDFHSFKLTDNHKRCSEDYDLFSLPLLSTPQLRIESSGAGVTRQNKIREIASFEPSYKYLNVCTVSGKNCSKCEKCIRTMIGLDAIDSLDKYKDVFDLDYFYKNKNYCYKQFLEYYYSGWKLHSEIYELIKTRIPLRIKLIAYFTIFRRKLTQRISPNIKSKIRTMYKRTSI